MSRDDKVVVFVPGVMGSTLEYRGPGKYGAPDRFEVWGENPRRNLHSLAAEPELLRKETPLQPTGILRRVAGFDIYGRLLDLISKTPPKGLGYDSNSILAFAYDWRQSNDSTAAKLASEIQRLYPDPERKILLLAHSMGGLIVKIMLASSLYENIRKRVHHFVQIASPILGSAEAYHTLKKTTRLHTAVNFPLRVYYSFRPTKLADLRQVVESFESIYQLLPKEKVLQGPAWKRSARDTQLWPNQLHDFLEKADELASFVDDPVPVPTTVCFSAGHRTVGGYSVNKHGGVLGYMRPRPHGDGTVTVESAIASSAVEQRQEITGWRTNHRRICSRRKLFKFLKEEFTHEGARV